MFESKIEKRMRRVKAISIFILGFLLGGWLERDYGAYDMMLSWFVEHQYLFEWGLILLAIISGVVIVIVVIYVEVKRYMLKKKEVGKNGGKEEGGN